MEPNFFIVQTGYFVSDQGSREGGKAGCLAKHSKLVQDIQLWKGGSSAPHDPPPPWIRPCICTQYYAI